MVTLQSYSAVLSILLAVFVYAGNDVNAAITEPRQVAALPQPEVDLKPGEVVRSMLWRVTIRLSRMPEFIPHITSHRLITRQTPDR